MMVIHKARARCIKGLCRRHLTAVFGANRAFTLVEVLVVLAVLLIVTSIALPITRSLLLNQKNSRAARTVVGYLDIARTRAISEGREVGVFLERLSNSTSTADQIPAASSIRIRQLTSVPGYSGDTANSRATLSDTNAAIPGIDTASFTKIDNQLLAVSAVLLNDGVATNDSAAPVHVGDRLELPGGRVVVITSITESGANVLLGFDLRRELSTGTSFAHPSGSRAALATLQQVEYRIHRRPVRSSTAPVTFPRGVVVDLNYSGIGLTGGQFRAGVAANNISIVFGPDGRIARINDSDGVVGIPSGQIFLCIGSTDGVRDVVDMFATERRATANILSPKSTWVVINQNTGRAVVAPFATVSQGTLALPQSTAAELATKLAQAYREARQLAILSDTLDAS